MAYIAGAFVAALLIANPVFLAVTLGLTAMAASIAGYGVACALPFLLIRYLLLPKQSEPVAAPVTVTPPRAELESPEFYRSLYWK